MRWPADDRASGSAPARRPRPLTRRRLLRGAAGTALAPALLDAARAWAANLPVAPEPEARLRLLRWRRFVLAEEEAFNAAVEAFTRATGVEVRIDSVGFEDLRPKAAVAANFGKGPDIVWGIHADAHLYPDAMLDLSDICEHLGGRHGGWYPIAEEYGRRRGRWISLPFTINGNLMNYRASQLRAVGFDAFPETTDDFLRCMQELKKAGTPGGMALGNASGDGNAWCYWLLWAFGGKVVDADNRVVIDSPETVAALSYAKELAATFVEDARSWLDVDNNKAFLDGRVSLTNNGISIYAAAEREGLDEIAQDIEHAPYPVGPVGRRTEFHVMFPMMAYGYTRYPNAAKALLLWLMEREQYGAFLRGSVGYLTHTLRDYADNPVWTEDPKRAPFRDIVEHTRSFAWEGELGYAAAGVFADFVVADMVVDVATGAKSPEEAAADAQKRAERYYDV